MVTEKSTENIYTVPCLYNPAQESPFSAVCPLTVSVPGSKSITNRALLLATLAKGVSTLRGVLFSDDSRHFLNCIQKLGFETHVEEERRTISVKGLGGVLPRKEADIYVGSAGTAARFLTAYLGLSQGRYRLDASAQMRRRPMAPLLDSLKELGCEILYDKDISDGMEGHFPFILQGHGFQKDEIAVNIDSSSQFLSALLISSCLCGRDFITRIQGSHGMSYIEMTLRMMEQFGVRVQRTAPGAFRTGAGQSYQARDYLVEPDVSAACYFYAMSPLLHIPVLVNHVHFDSLQGDVAFLHLLEQMGCTAKDTPEGVLVMPPADRRIHGIRADMSACSDQAITLAAIAPFADSPTTISHIGHIRLQESDRIAAMAAELTRMGIRCEEEKDAITIYPGMPRPATVETYDDHRMAMGFSLIGLRCPGVLIDNPRCCRKTFEGYFDLVDQIAQSFQKG
ncbi:MAG: 3-phosphoshikimate 1-carboxyvinyltransferase [Lachnospiraceae bacterium]|jgi:3-phosphoshikimate 1-carboxyvinyltransferase|nr:3-phosphoshikimate 1-carboxyvinyltransferase [Lachnospiraceae bacterium]